MSDEKDLLADSDAFAGPTAGTTASIEGGPSEDDASELDSSQEKEDRDE